MADPLSTRKSLPHAVPAWVGDGAVFFITLNAQDRGGTPLLAADRPARLWESARWRMERGLWWPRLFLLMPDHLHMMASFPRARGMGRVVRDWKHWTAHELGIAWQRDFFDHRIRNAAEYEEKAHYIRMNPVRRDLVATAKEWPHVWTMPAPIW